MVWTLVCASNKDGVLVRYCNKINATEVEYINTSKIVEQDDYTEHPPFTVKIFTVHYSPYRDGLITFLVDRVE